MLVSHDLVLAGIWYGEKKLTMTTFLSPFLKDTNRLLEDTENAGVCTHV